MLVRKLDYDAAGRKTPDLGATIQSVITSTPPHPRDWGTTPTTTPPSTTVTTPRYHYHTSYLLLEKGSNNKKVRKSKNTQSRGGFLKM